MVDQFLESDHLVQGIGDLAARKTDAQLRTVPAANQLAAREVVPEGVMFEPVLPHGNDDSDDDESPV